MTNLDNRLKRAELNAKYRDQQAMVNLDSVNLESQKAIDQGYGLFKLKKPNKAVFTQTINDNLEILIDQQYLTNSELGFILSLMPFIELHSNAIVNDKNQFMTVSEMATKLKRERTRTSKTITQLVKKGVVFEFVNAQEIREFKRNISKRPFFMNPEIVYRGNRNQVNATLARLVTEFDILEKKKILLDWKLWLNPGEKYGRLYRRKRYLELKKQRN